MSDQPSHETSLQMSSPTLNNITEAAPDAVCLPEAPLSTSDQITPLQAAERTARRILKQRKRLESRFTPTQIASRERRKLKKKERKESEVAIIKEACIRKELKRTKRTKFSCKAFQTIHIQRQSLWTQQGSSSESISSDNSGDQSFVGQIHIQDYVSAMKQALTEYAQYGDLRKQPGRLAFFVDGGVSGHENLTGLAVVFKANRRDWMSSWTVKGYRINEALQHDEAEAWAIRQGLQVTLEEVRAGGLCAESRHPWSVAAIYSDSAPALITIRRGSPDTSGVIREIFALLRDLERLGVEVHLHWVPARRGIPGNELADLVVKKARQPFKRSPEEICKAFRTLSIDESRNDCKVSR